MDSTAAGVTWPVSLSSVITADHLVPSHPSGGGGAMVDEVAHQASPLPDTSDYTDGGSIAGFMTNVSTLQPPEGVEVKWPMLGLAAVIVVCLAANLMILVTVSCSKRLQVPFYQLMASLAAADIVCAATALPAAVTRAFLDGAVPTWLCQTWQWSYMGCTSLRLSHVIMATLYCHISLHNPLCCRVLVSSACYVSIAVFLAWIFPPVLLLPNILLQLYTPEASSGLYHCLPLDVNHFYAGVVPTFLVPCIAMVAVYAQVVYTVNSQIYMAQQLQSEPNSDISSNDLATYENTECENGNMVFTNSQTIPALPISNSSEGVIQNYETTKHSEKAPSATITTDDRNDKEGYVLPASDIINEDFKPLDPFDTEQNNDDDTGDNDSMIVHPDKPLYETEGERLAGDCQRDSSSLSSKVSENGGVELGDNKVSLVHVKGKPGKEALNEPIDDEDVKLHWELASILLNQTFDQLEMDNPCFDLEQDPSEDLPLSESIKVKNAINSQNPVLLNGDLNGGFDAKEPNGCYKPQESPTPSNDGSAGTNDTYKEGHRSILKREGSKRGSSKSVTFDIPERVSSRWKRKKPRRLSCKYKSSKNSPKVNGVGGQATIYSNGRMQEINSQEVLKLAEDKLHQIQAYRYLVNAQSCHGKRLTKRILTNKTCARVLYYMFLLIVSFNLPFMLSTSLMVFKPQITETIPYRLYMLFEWLGYVPAFIFPFLYLCIFSEFRKEILSPRRSSMDHLP